MNPLDVRFALAERGWTIRRWALTRGRNPRTVAQVIARHAGGSVHNIRGIATRNILLALSREIDAEIVHGLSEEELI